MSNICIFLGLEGILGSNRPTTIKDSLVVVLIDTRRFIFTTLRVSSLEPLSLLVSLIDFLRISLIVSHGRSTGQHLGIFLWDLFKSWILPTVIILSLHPT